MGRAGTGSAGGEDGSIYWLISRFAASVINANEALPYVCGRGGGGVGEQLLMSADGAAVIIVKLYSLNNNSITT